MKLKHLKEQPLLSPPGGDFRRRFEVTDSDWADMVDFMNRTAHPFYKFEILCWMKELDGKKAAEVIQRLGSSPFFDMESYLGEIRRDYRLGSVGSRPAGERPFIVDRRLGSCGFSRKGGIANLLHYARLFDKSTAPEPSDEDWGEMKDVLEIARERNRGDAVAWQLYYMNSIDPKRASRPINADWELMNLKLAEARVNCDGALIAEFLYIMKELDPESGQSPSDSDWRHMEARLAALRKQNDGGKIGKLIYHLRGLSRPGEGDSIQQPMPPLKRFGK